jgi:PAS/PAC sensor hybrid histidine kinase (EC 2.7.13.3)
MGFIELLQDPDTTGDERREYIEIIEKSGNRMLGTINDIINISKIEAGIVS